MDTNTCGCDCRTWFARTLLVSLIASTVCLSCCCVCCYMVLNPSIGERQSDNDREILMQADSTVLPLQILNQPSKKITPDKSKSSNDEVSIQNAEVELSAGLQRLKQVTLERNNGVYGVQRLLSYSESDLSHPLLKVIKSERQEAEMAKETLRYELTRTKRAANKKNRKEKRPRKCRGKGKEKNPNCKDRKEKRAKKNKKTSLLAAQYVPVVSSETGVRNKFNDFVETKKFVGWKNITEMNGTLYRSGHFLPNHYGPMTFFTKSTWIEDHHDPLTRNANGTFTPKKAGVFLIHAQVMFYDNRSDKGAAIVQHRYNSTTHSMDKIIDHSCSDSGPPTNVPFSSSCSVMALFKLENNDVISVENIYGSKIVLYNTYFLAIKLF